MNERASAAEPYVAWVKEGRKYDLGAVLVTQQPGSIPDEILSQGDNWFIFHLLSAFDLTRVQKANAHFSEDILSVLLNEPIPGHCAFWSSVGGNRAKPYPVSLRILSFEELYHALDPLYGKSAVDTFASELRQKYTGALTALNIALAETDTLLTDTELLNSGITKPLEDAVLDPRAAYEELCCRILGSDEELIRRFNTDMGVPWGELVKRVEDQRPEVLAAAYRSPHQVVRIVLERILGREGQDWEQYERPKKADPSKNAKYVRRRSM